MGGSNLGSSEEVEVTETRHDQEGRGEKGVKSPGHPLRQPVLQLPVARQGVHSLGQALQCDAQEVEERPDEDEIHGPVPDVHEGEADGAAEQLGEERGGEEGDDGYIDVTEEKSYS